ncbi:MAG: ATP-binding protein [Roseiflexaceae bacterium]
MRSLTVKLTLAFLLTGVVAVALVGVFARYLTGAAFGQLVREQELVNFTDTVADYYAQYGNWQGVDEYLRRNRPALGAAAQNGTAVQGGRSGQPGPPPQNNRQAPPFVLADSNGIALSRSPDFRMGEQLPPNVLAGGTPVEVNGQRVGTVVRVSGSLQLDERQRDYLARTDQTMFYAMIAGGGLALLVGVVLARLIMRPIQALTTAIRAVRPGGGAQQVAISSRDELGELVRAFNTMSAELAHANAARRQMTADIAHDLRTPLSVLTGYIEAMRDGVLAPTRDRFQTMYDEAALLQRLIDELRLLSLADAGELKLQRQPVAPAQLLASAAASFEQRAVAQQVGLSVQAADLPPLLIDRERMQQVLGNLISNALRYTPAGGTISLRARAEQQPAAPNGSTALARPGQAVLIEVADTGQGIAPEHLPQIFNRFYRADASRSASDGGSGLGLAIARAIVEAHGGSIIAASTVGQGTCIGIRLPVQ